MKICICSSMTFYKEFCEVKEKLESMGHIVLIPELRIEQKEGNTSVRGYIEANGGIDNFPPEHDIWGHKENAMRSHFDKINESDCVLVTNYEKNGIPGYIGGNTFLEMGYAFGTNKKVYILNKIPNVNFKEELLGMRPVVLSGDISLIK